MKHSRILRVIGAASVAAGLALGFGCSRTVDAPDADLLGWVPAGTPYLHLSAAPYPEVLQQRLADHRAAEVAAMRVDLADAIVDLRRTATAPALGDAARRLADLLEAVIVEVAGRDDAESLRELGIEPLPRGVVFGHGVFPAFRIGIADPVRFTALLDRIEQRSGMVAARGQSQGLDYRRLDLGPVHGVIAMEGGYVIGGLAPRDAFDDYLPRLLGQETPAQSLADSGSVTALRTRYGFTGISEGFVDLEQLVRLVGPGGDAGVAAMGGAQAFDDGCIDLLGDLLAHAPRVVHGLTRADAAQLTWRTTWEATPPVAAALQRIAAPVNGLGRDDDALLALGFGVNLPELRNALVAALRALIDDGGRCPQIDRAALGNAIPTLNLALGPLTAGIRGLHLRVADLAIDGTDLRPDTLSAAALAAVDDPRGVLALLAMFDPQLRRLELPADGTPVPLPPLPGAIAGDVPLQIALADRGLLLLAGPGAERVAAPLREPAATEPLPLLALDYGLADIIERIGPDLEAALDRLASRDPELADTLRRQLDGYRRQAALMDRVRVRVFADGNGLATTQTLSLR
jgi:hypothetical protein